MPNLLSISCVCTKEPLVYAREISCACTTLLCIHKRIPMCIHKRSLVYSQEISCVHTRDSFVYTQEILSRWGAFVFSVIFGHQNLKLSRWAHFSVRELLDLQIKNLILSVLIILIDDITIICHPRTKEPAVFATFQHLSSPYPFGQMKWTLYNPYCLEVHRLHL